MAEKVEVRNQQAGRRVGGEDGLMKGYAAGVTMTIRVDEDLSMKYRNGPWKTRVRVEGVSMLVVLFMVGIIRTKKR